MMGVFIEYLYLSLTNSVCLNQNRDKSTRKVSGFQLNAIPYLSVRGMTIDGGHC